MTRLVPIVSAMCGATLILSSCTDRSTESPKSASEPIQTIVPTSGVPLFDLPRVDGIAIDGKTDDWSDRGLRVAVLANADGEAGDPRSFSGSFRAGWNDAGIVLSIEVRDLTSQESTDAKKLYMGDCIEIFVTTNAVNGSNIPDAQRNVLQAVFAPGMNDTQPDLRTWLYDYRSTASIAGLLHPHVDAARMSRVGGYHLETLIPWDNLGVHPHPGLLAGLQVQIGDGGNPSGNAKLLWNGTPGTGHIVRLSEAPTAATSTLAATARYKGYKSILVDLTALGNATGPVELTDGLRVLQTVNLVDRPDGLATARVELPAPADGAPERIVVRTGGESRAYLPLPPVTQVRQQAFDRISFNLSSALFAGDAFPTGSWSDPELLAATLGTGSTTTVTYYDAEARPVTAPVSMGRYAAIAEAVSADGSRRISRFLTLCRVPALPEPGSAISAEILHLAPALGSRFPKILESVKDGSQGSAEAAAALLAATPDQERISVRNDTTQHRYRVMTAHGLEKPYPVVPLLPEGYESHPEQRYPLILFLHGSGRGTQSWADIEPTRVFLSQHREYPFILVQLLSEQGWPPVKVLDQLAVLQKTYRIDPERMYLCGFSMGGAGTWDVLHAASDLFAAAVPTASRTDPDIAARLAGVPLWVFHGDIDWISSDGVRGAVSAIVAAKGEAKLTILRNTDHIQTPLTAFGERDVYDWLLAHRRAKP